MPVAKEQIRQIIAGNNISSVADVYSIRELRSDCKIEEIYYNVDIKVDGD